MTDSNMTPNWKGILSSLGNIKWKISNSMSTEIKDGPNKGKWTLSDKGHEALRTGGEGNLGIVGAYESFKMPDDFKTLGGYIPEGATIVVTVRGKLRNLPKDMRAQVLAEFQQGLISGKVKKKAGSDEDGVDPNEWLKNLGKGGALAESAAEQTVGEINLIPGRRK